MTKILAFLKHIFIPHDNNNYKPHFFRGYFVLIICLIAIVLFAFAFKGPKYIKNTNMTAAVLPAVLVDLANEDRTKNNLNELSVSPLLTEAARLKAEDMAKNAYFAHTSPTGLTPWYWMAKSGYDFIYAGENLAVDFTESIDVENAWLASPKHRANIMDNRFTEVGIATFDANFEGKQTTFVVQMFGKPILNNTKNTPTQVLVVEKTIDNTTNKNKIVTPNVKGESITTVPNVKVVEESKDFIAVKNVDIVNNNEIKVEKPTNDSIKYSKWYQRVFYNSPVYVNIAYKILILIVIIALMLLIFIEIKKQHPKNIMYGVLLLILVIVLFYINRRIFMHGLFY